MVVWMHEDPLVRRAHLHRQAHHPLGARHRARYPLSRGRQHDWSMLPSDAIAMNEIAEVEFETNLPLFFDSYRDCRETGSLILIDPLTQRDGRRGDDLEARSKASREAAAESEAQRPCIGCAGLPARARSRWFAMRCSPHGDRRRRASTIDADCGRRRSPAVVRALATRAASPPSLRARLSREPCSRAGARAFAESRLARRWTRRGARRCERRMSAAHRSETR